MTTLEAYCEAVGWQGGTIHQAKLHFATVSPGVRNSIAAALTQKMAKISDTDVAWDFLTLTHIHPEDFPLSFSEGAQNE